MSDALGTFASGLKDGAGAGGPSVLDLPAYVQSIANYDFQMLGRQASSPSCSSSSALDPFPGARPAGSLRRLCMRLPTVCRGVTAWVGGAGQHAVRRAGQGRLAGDRWARWTGSGGGLSVLGAVRAYEL